jgi:hypothetical protein
MLQTIMRARTVVIVVGLLAAGARMASAQAGAPFRDSDRVGIAVYDNVNFEGQATMFRTDVPDLRDYRMNDRISSLRVARGEFWEACEDAEYRGRCIVFSGDERDLRDRGWNDMISSLRRVRGPGGSGDRDRDHDRGGFVPPPFGGEIVLFDRPGYRGRLQNVTEPAPALGEFGGRARSAQILDGAWELCEGPRFSGRCVRIDGSVPDLGRIGLGGVLSARPVGPAR